MTGGASAESESGGREQPLRILLIEDSIPNQKVALAILEGRGHSVVVADDGQEGVSLFASQEFDVVLMDVQMPVMDGFECTAAIRAIEARTGGHVPIIAMTAHALQGDREKCLAAGMDEYVSKPIRRDGLFRALSKVISPRPAVVDWEQPLAQLDGNREVLRDVVVAYLDEIREHLALLPDVVATAEWREVRRRAHTIKSAMRTFGVSAAAEIAAKIERLGEAGGAEQGAGADTRDLLDSLERASQPVVAELVWFVETGWRQPLRTSPEE